MNDMNFTKKDIKAIKRGIAYKTWNRKRRNVILASLILLDKAFIKIPDNTGLILHSDQGWQYQMKCYQARLKEKGIVQSMSRKGNCLDNSVMENFFGLLKTEMYYKHEFLSAEHLIKEIEEYIDYYNNRRIKCKLKGLSPVQYRIHSNRVA